MKIMTGKRGSILVEAVLIIPLIIVISVMMICVSIYMYVNTLTVSEMDRETRTAAGQKAETVFYTGTDEISRGNHSEIISEYEGETEFSRVFRNGSFYIKADMKNVFDPGVKWLRINKNICTVSCPEINECQELWKRQYGVL